MKLHIVSEDQAAQIGKAALVPVFRVRDTQSRLMGWAERNNHLRGATEIQFQGNGEAMEVLIVGAKSDA